MIEIITRYLSEYNFSPVFKSDNYYHYIYSGKIETSRFGDVSIDLVFSKDGIISFPTAYINEKSREKFTPFHFPHLDDNWVLCYHDNSIVFDIVNIKSSIDIIFTNIKYIFNNVCFDDMNEIIPEFKSYWAVTKTYFSHFTNIPEFVSKENLWFKEPVSICPNNSKVYVLEEVPSLKSCNWPINNLTDLSNWLKNANIIKEIENTLYLNLRDKKSKTYCLFYTKKEKYFFGVTFIYRNPILKQKHPKRLHDNTIKTIIHNHEVKRFWIDNIIDKNLVYSNLPTNFPTLDNLKIALIGAGTIGSNLSSMLVKLGAGTAKEKQFAIIDSDIYKPENYSRHILSFSDFGKEKAKAVAYELKRSNPHLNIESFADSVEKYHLEQFDIIIDSTGEENVTDYINQKYFENKLNALFIVSWIHITGEKVESLIIPNRTKPCHKCFKLNNLVPRNHVTTDLPKRNGCSSVFAPFPIMLSVNAALLTIRVLLDYLQGKIQTTTLYSQKIYENNQIEKQLINFSKDCDICLKI